MAENVAVKNSDKKARTAKPRMVVGGFRFKYVFLSVMILLFILALVSHSPEDMAVIEGGSDELVRNWIGPAGANVSRLMFYLFGVAIYPITAILVVSAARPFLSFPINRRGYIGALISLCLGITIFFAIWPTDFCSYTEKLGIGAADVPWSALSGGVIGQQLAAPGYGDIEPGLIRRVIGTIGTCVVASVLVLTGAIFVFLADWKSVVFSFFSSFDSIAGEAGGLLRRRQTSDEEELEDAEEKVVSEAKPLSLFARTRETNETKAAVLPEKEIKPVAEVVEAPQEKAEIFPDPKKVTAPKLTGDEPLLRPLSGKKKDSLDMGRSSFQLSSEFILPPVTMLQKQEDAKTQSADWLEESKRILQRTLESFKVEGMVTNFISGPRVTRFEISLAPGVKVEKVTSIANNIAMELEAKSIRILAPIPGKNAIGVEVPNAVPSGVSLRSMMETPEWKAAKAAIPIVLGKDVGGKPVVMDLSRAPHLLIAGATGSGKSVCMNTLIMSLLFKFSPEDLRLILVDPKVVELEMYTPLPHLITPVVNDPQKVPIALRWAVNEMEKRYRILAKVKTKNLEGFNKRPIPSEPVLDDAGNEIPAKMPILVIIVDELADVMMTEAKGDVETSIARIAQKGRASGIHIVIATQRPSTNIITGVIKANLPSRIAFQVGSIVDSRVILDQKGAESLLGRGDMLFVPPGGAVLERIQGAMVEDSDIQKVVEFVAGQAEQNFDDKVISGDESELSGDDGEMPEGDDDDFDESSLSEGLDPLIREMVAKYSEPSDDENIIKSLEILFRERKISTSYIQRRLGIGYNKAAEIMDIFEKRNLVSPPLAGGSKRNILVFDEIENN
ncbi:MAG: hypothetical protein A2020_08845 [Lentisphaerae bacterium GWF2_45_14]|nr:MAG: hypothetical protein A2020_08845 [Lentisphaerae bacterium GWF2_45_14]